jgi:sugar/nucleoside kinase (ribokinase family)
MRQILVIGSVNHDRIWQLESPIASGRRVRVRGKSLVLGGGGFGTGQALLELGEAVALVSRLRRDELGLAALKTLNDIGFRTQHVELVDGETKPLDILLDPSGERTILIPLRDGDGPIQITEAAPAAAAYINALRPGAALLDVLGQTPLVISQLPLTPATARPADFVISSRDDIGGDIPGAWRRAVDLAGTRLKSLIVTNGPDPIVIHDGTSSRHIETSRVSGTCNSLGAGDHFAGALLHALLNDLELTEAVHAAAVETAKWLERRRERNSA